MIKHKRIGAVAALLMSVVLIVTAFVYINPSVLDPVTGTSAPAYVSAIDKARVIDLQIVADPKDWADMLENATAEEYIPATVVIDGAKIESVGIRPKGNSSLSTVARDSTTDRYSFKIEFDHYITGQTWMGLDKLAVNNMQGDASYMKEYLSYDIMDYAGVAAPLYAFADISVNGEAWGFYLAVECLEDSYARRVYGNDHGKLYKPEGMGMRGAGRMDEFIEEMENNNGWNQQQPRDNQQNPARGQAWEQAPGAENRQAAQGGDRAQGGVGGVGGAGGMGDRAQGGVGGAGGVGGMGGMGGGMSSSGVSLQYVGDQVSSYSAIFDNSVLDSTEKDHLRVVKALQKLSSGEDLENTVDIAATLKYFAAHTVVVNLDSYVSNMGHNYYLYEKDGKLTILPWDYNLAFGGFQSRNASNVVNFPIDTPVSGVSLEDRPLLGKLLERPEYLELYHGYLREIVEGYFNSGLFEQTVDSITGLISPHVEADPSAFYDYEAYRAAIAELKKLGLLRAKSIQGQLDGSIPSTSVGQSAEPGKLVDVSELNLSALGSQGGGMGGGERAQGGQNFDRNAGMQGGMGNRRPDNGQNGAGNIPNRNQGNPGFANPQQPTATGFNSGGGLLAGGCLALLMTGLAFVILFKRRRCA